MASYSLTLTPANHRYQLRRQVVHYSARE